MRAQNPNHWTARALPAWLFLCFFISDHASLSSSSTLASAAARPLPTLFISHCCDTGEPVSAPQPTEASACSLSPFGARTSKALNWGCGQLDVLSDQAPLMTRCPVHPRALVVWGQEPHCAGLAAGLTSSTSDCYASGCSSLRLHSLKGNGPVACLESRVGGRVTLTFHLGKPRAECPPSPPGTQPWRTRCASCLPGALGFTRHAFSHPFIW